MLTRFFRRRQDDDAGVSLVEMIVGMTLSVILGAVTLAMVVAVNDSASATNYRVFGAAQARTALQAWSSYLRVADGITPGSPAHRFEWVTPTSTLFYADLNNRTGLTQTTSPVRIWLRLDSSGNLVEEQFSYNTASGAYPSQPSVCRVLASRVSSLTFTAYTSSSSDTDFGASLAPSGSGCLSITGSVSQTDGVANSTLAKVASVSIDVIVSDLTGRTQEYSTAATIPVLMGS